MLRRACDRVEACIHSLFWADFMALFVIVCGLLRGHCMACLRVSLLDYGVTCFGCQYVYSNVLTCDEFLCANGHYIA